MTHISGSCLCGQVTFSGEIDIMGVANCHCDDCRKATGAVYGTLVFAKEKTIEIKGETHSYEHTADSGNTLTKINCANCGTPMFTHNSSRPGMGIRAGVVDQGDLIAPARYVYSERALASTPIDESLESHVGMPG